MTTAISDDEVINISVWHGEDGIVDEAVDNDKETNGKGISHESLCTGVGEEI